jgi:hypothetical protein
MALSNAEKQARHRAKRSREIEHLRSENNELVGLIERLNSNHAELLGLVKRLRSENEQLRGWVAYLRSGDAE